MDVQRVAYAYDDLTIGQRYIRLLLASVVQFINRCCKPSKLKHCIVSSRSSSTCRTYRSANKRHGIRLPWDGRQAKRFQGGDPPAPSRHVGSRPHLRRRHGHGQRVQHLRVRAPRRRRRQGHRHLQKISSFRLPSILQHRGDGAGGGRDLPAGRQGRRRQRLRRRRRRGAEACPGDAGRHRRRRAGAAQRGDGRGVRGGRRLRPADQSLRRHRRRRRLLPAGAEVEALLARRRHLGLDRRLREGCPAALLRVALIVRRRPLLSFVGVL